jgi:hypothetical protein
MMHAAITAAVQCALMLAGVPPIAAGLVPVAFYAGREHAQAEQRIIEQRFGSRRLMPWWGGFLADAWKLSAVLDVAAPAVVAVAIAFFSA